MSAEPATPIPPGLNTPGEAAVIDITRRRGKTAASTRGRWTTVTDHDQPRPGPDPQALFAEQAERAFNDIDRTLSDEETALVYLRTLAIVGRALEGAEAMDIITSEQLSELGALIEGMKAAPRLV
ncbi:hypothetical protein [Streptomyces carpinensis]|uniref:hypothetical protein n=1 Tax=Streptomyces carpinensis TaxID=66369 RepID=UPI00117D3A66|nr:hypothetical protein [Streptomyces carpinensis]